ncbi:MAG: DUF3604 domain-containing protein [Cyclobacteriaceae bacterium]
MKRRTFIRNSALLSASTFLLPAWSCSAVRSKSNMFEALESLQLSDFEDEQDESPILFQNKSNTYLTTLRRKEYPADKEIISLFRWNKGQWEEQNPVTSKEGSYEAVTADCHSDGLPAVAWAEIENGSWTIKVTIQSNGNFPRPTAISQPSKRSINPVVKAISENEYLLAWESFEEGKFSIYLSSFKNGEWTIPRQVTERERNCFHPALEGDTRGNIYLAYDVSDGPHRNIEMKIIDGVSKVKTIPIAIGGGFRDRVNVNTKPALAFDKSGKLWISWENNRFAHRLQDGDNYTGDRCCAMVCYHDGQLWTQESNGRWLFKGKNDHWPNFQKDQNNNLFAVTHCGGDFEGNPFWKFRVSYLDPDIGWTQPVTILETKQKGESIKPTLAFDNRNEYFWMAWKSEQYKERDYDHPGEYDSGTNQERRGMLEMNKFSSPVIIDKQARLDLVPAIVEEHHPTENFFPKLSGRPKSKRNTIEHNGEIYHLLIGNFHEHSEISSCWPAGTDGTLHDDYRFGLTSEGYDFMGITDHAYSQTEVYWRKHLRLADFYNDGENFVAFPSVEWTLSNERNFEIRRGAGHRNIIFKTTADARKYVRNKNEVYSVNNPETADAEKLWQYIHKRGINCISIPHHPADEVHACCWETRDEEIEPIVEIFQCRGNAEYRGAPRMINVERHKPTDNDKGFIDYALRDKKYKLGFIASGDHNSIGVGLACIWVKEISREGIFEAMKNRRVFGTTGDQIEMDFRLNGTLQGQSTKSIKAPQLALNISAVDDIQQVDILRNSKVIETITPTENTRQYSSEFSDSGFKNAGDVLYYYVRVIQKNQHIGWSSPIWVES